MGLPFGLSPGAGLFMALALFVAAFVRGYSGFGFAALSVTASSLVTDPLHFVPLVILADAAMTLQQWRGIRSDIEWRRVLALFAGALAGVPVGLWLFRRVGEDAARAAIALFVLLMCAAMLYGWRMARPMGRAAHTGAGAVSGLANAAAVGGLPVAVFFAAQAIGAAAFRATLIMYFALLDLWTLTLMGSAGMVSHDTFLAAGLAAPVLFAGIWLGSRHFLSTSPAEFRRFAILLLAGLSLIALGKSLV
ncbi:MAG: sulfite exporter TauE/SafE family protein [Paracoccaceae bacterium]|nr:sulfite exporter TauE/SafE family protein [Paracoccaceae bacterium]